MIGKVKVWSCQIVCIPELATGEVLQRFNADELANYAKSIGVNPGKTKQDTIRNLVESGKASVTVTLGT